MRTLPGKVDGDLKGKVDNERKRDLPCKVINTGKN